MHVLSYWKHLVGLGLIVEGQQDAPRYSHATREYVPTAAGQWRSHKGSRTGENMEIV